MPSFLRLPRRSEKPRFVGLTHVIDKGLPLGELSSQLAATGEYVDVWKFGFGTAYLDPTVEEKVAALTASGIRACLGGTLLEVAWAQGRAEECLNWAGEAGFACVEVSNGSCGMPLDAKRRLIATASRNFVAISEVGSKNPSTPVSTASWVDEMAGDLEAGATWVLAEGRESGTVGLYHSDGRVREDLAEALVAAVGLRWVVFEAPRSAQQAWFVSRFGSAVNLGNIAPAELLALESLRLGLRADTFGLGQPVLEDAAGQPAPVSETA
ncbi:MAG: phosphosulfolactate synthase [Acidimicrobiales bacterium]